MNLTAYCDVCNKCLGGITIEGNTLDVYFIEKAYMYKDTILCKECYSRKNALYYKNIPLIDGINLVDADGCIYTLFFDNKTLEWKVKNNQTPFIVKLTQLNQDELTVQ